MSWLSIPPDSPFSINNIPFGIISYKSGSPSPTPRPAIAIGTWILDLHAFTSGGGFARLPEFTETSVFTGATTLNAFAQLGRRKHQLVREYLQSVLSATTPVPEVLRDDPSLAGECLRPASEVACHLPMSIGDYTDFYAGRNHAFNVGSLFRGPAAALQPNYEHLPVGYHGRASSVVVSGTEVVRPVGQVACGDVRPTEKLDFELELAVLVGKASEIGERVSAEEAGEYLFGVVLMNDWSARDIQAWEYVPLGPFTSKSFATSISPWVVLMDALEPFRTTPLQRSSNIPLVPYLCEPVVENVYDLPLNVSIQTQTGTYPLTTTSSKNLLFSFPQMLAHHTVTGCPLRPGDLLGSGTISGTTPNSLGCLLEMTRNGAEKIHLLASGESRGFLEDGDVVVMTGGTTGVGFGECVGRVVRARGAF